MSAVPSIIEAGIDRAEILGHLEQILSDRRFSAAERNAKFLRYVVESTLDGRASEIKETVIATEVYGRASDYDPKSDSIVRVEASRLRQKLRTYYENEGKGSTMRVHLPSGSYVPLFERLEPAPGLDSSPTAVRPEPEPAPKVTELPAQGKQSRRNRLVAGTGIFLLAAMLWLVSAKRHVTTDPKNAEAMAAWKEAIALLELDPHTAQTVSGPPKTLLRAIERLEFSVAVDPLRAQSWATLAEAYDYASGFVGRDPAEDARRVEAAVTRAIALDDKLAAGHHMQGLFLKGTKWDFGQAEKAYRRALQLDPRNAWAAVELADLLWETGRPGQAAEEIRKERALLPAMPVLAVKEAELQLHLGNADAALVTAKSAVEMKRTSLRAHVALGMAYERKGDYASALARYEHVLQSNPTDRRALPAYGYLLATTGQTGRAREIVAQLENINATVRNCAFQIAMVYAGMGEDERALEWLETAWRTRQAHFPFAAAEYRFRKYHQNPRFRVLLDRVGLRPASR